MPISGECKLFSTPETLQKKPLNFSGFSIFTKRLSLLLLIHHINVTFCYISLVNVIPALPLNCHTFSTMSNL